MLIKEGQKNNSVLSLSLFIYFSLCNKGAKQGPFFFGNHSLQLIAKNKERSGECFHIFSFILYIVDTCMVAKMCQE